MRTSALSDLSLRSRRRLTGFASQPRRAIVCEAAMCSPWERKSRHGLIKSDAGAAAIEYALLVTLIAVAILAALAK